MQSFKKKDPLFLSHGSMDTETTIHKCIFLSRHMQMKKFTL